MNKPLTEKIKKILSKFFSILNPKTNFSFFENLRKPSGFFVPKSGQFRYGIYFALLILAVLFGFSAVFVFMRFAPQWLSCDADPLICKAIASEENLVDLTPMLKNLLLFGTIGVITAFFLGLFVAHSTFGPKVRIKKHIDQLIKGDYSSRLSLRKKDQLKDIAEKLNSLTEELEKKRK